MHLSFSRHEHAPALAVGRIARLPAVEGNGNHLRGVGAGDAAQHQVELVAARRAQPQRLAHVRKVAQLDAPANEQGVNGKNSILSNTHCTVVAGVADLAQRFAHIREVAQLDAPARQGDT